jgi:CubicO group peptidase (beta-lactamase class C family)
MAPRGRSADRAIPIDRRPRWRVTVSAALAALVALACGRDPAAAPVEQLGQDAATYWPGVTWRSATPAEVGVDGPALASLVSRLRSGALGAEHALVIVRKGYVIADEYFGGWTAESIHTEQSVTKSVASLVTGIAIARGDIHGVDQPLVELLSRYAPIANLDDRKRALTVRDVLTMRTGLDWNEDSYPGSPLERLNNLQTDWLRFVVDWPMREQPGTRWQYNSGGVIALGGAIGIAGGMNTADYARTHLLRPIGITGDKWYRGFPDALPHTGGGLFVSTRDLARVGYLVLRRGKWNTTQVVPESWITESTRPIVTPTYRLGGRQSSYGYLWWLYTLSGGTPDASAVDMVIAASGAQGQWLFIVPKHDLVVAINAGITSGPDPALDMMFATIIPAMR